MFQFAFDEDKLQVSSRAGRIFFEKLDLTYYLGEWLGLRMFAHEFVQI